MNINNFNAETATLKPSDIAVLILSTQARDYDCFKSAIRNTWMKRFLDAGINTYFYSGNHCRNKIVDHEIMLSESDELKATAKKLKGAVKELFAAHPNLKLVYRTNLSSYVVLDNFLLFVKKHQLDSKTYTGILGETTYLREYFYGNRPLHLLFTKFPLGRVIHFASGSGFFIGADYAKQLIDLDRGDELIDDVMVASSLNIVPNFSGVPARFDVLECGKHKVGAETYRHLVEEKLLFHYRFKTNDRARDALMLEMFDDPMVRAEECTLT